MPSTEKPLRKQKGRSGGGPPEENFATDEEKRQKLKEQVSQMQDRLMFLLDDWAPATYKYNYLQSRTGIPASSWQNFFLGKQKATVEMLMAISMQMPAEAQWLMTGWPIKDANGKSVLPPDGAFEKYLERREWARAQKSGT